MNIQETNIKKIRSIFDSESGLFDLKNVINHSMLKHRWMEGYDCPTLERLDYKKYSDVLQTSEELIEEELDYRAGDKLKLRSGITCDQIINFMLKITKEQGFSVNFYQVKDDDSWNVCFIDLNKKLFDGVEYTIINQNILKKAFKNYNGVEILNNDNYNEDIEGSTVSTTKRLLQNKENLISFYENFISFCKENKINKEKYVEVKKTFKEHQKNNTLSIFTKEILEKINKVLSEYYEEDGNFGIETYRFEIIEFESYDPELIISGEGVIADHILDLAIKHWDDVEKLIIED